MRFLVERIYLWNAFIRVTHLSLWNVFICGKYFFVERTPIVFVERLFGGTPLFVECCYKVTAATQEVENVDKVDKEKVEEESKLALVEVQVTEITAREEVGSNKKVNEAKDMEEEPAEVPPQQVRPREKAATKNSLRLSEQNALATTKKKRSWRRRRSLEIEEKNVHWSKLILLCRRIKKGRDE
jgi:hypothetical protein